VEGAPRHNKFAGETMSQPLILIATPCFGGMVSQNYMLSVIRLMSYAKSAEFDVSLSMLAMTP